MISVAEKQQELFHTPTKREVPNDKKSVGIIYRNGNGSLFQGDSFERLKTLTKDCKIILNVYV